MPQLAAATKPHHCCLFAAIHCEKPFVSIRDCVRCIIILSADSILRLDTLSETCVLGRFLLSRPVEALPVGNTAN